MLDKGDSETHCPPLNCKPTFKCSTTLVIDDMWCPAFVLVANWHSEVDMISLLYTGASVQAVFESSLR